MTVGDEFRLPSDSGGGLARVTDIDPDGNVTIAMPGGKSVVNACRAGHSTQGCRDHERRGRSPPQAET
jgi:hypothetical protein